MSKKYGRRRFLSAAGAVSTTTLLAGCSESESRPEPSTSTNTDTSSETEEESDTDLPSEDESSDPEELPSNASDFEYLLGLETDYHLDSSEGDQITREYVAYSGGSRTTLTQTFSENVYNFYHNQTRQYVDNYQYKYGSYVSDQLDNYLIDSIISSFEDYGARNNKNERQIIEHMMSFVQNLEYTSDKAGTGWNDYPKYPIETLVEREGDCEDTAILMANLLRNFGYGTKLIYATAEMTDGDAEGHMAVGIKGNEDVRGTYYTDDRGDRYYFIETTSAGTPIGEAPPWMNSAYLQPVGIHPLPGAVGATVTGVDENQITVKGETVNTGPVGSNSIQIRVSLIDSDRYIVDQSTSSNMSVSGFDGDLDNIGTEHQATEEMTLRAEQPMSMTLVAESLVSGNEVSQTESALRSPQ